MLAGRRRIVTGHNPQGRSVVLIDGPPGKTLPRGQGGGLGEIWSALPGPVNSLAKDDPTQGEVVLSPPAGGHRFRWFAIAPEDPDEPDDERRRRYEGIFASMGATHEQVDTTRHPAMHKTGTIDYVVLLSGEVTLLLDDDERDLKPFDVVVQQGTNHAWVNKGKETALLIAVLIDAEIQE